MFKIEKILRGLKEEFSMLGAGLKIIIKIVLFIVTILLLIRLFSFFWGYLVNENFRLNNRSIEKLFCIVLPILSAGLIFRKIWKK